jgi:addiction module RelB/DinJ family antitoxin
MKTTTIQTRVPTEMKEKVEKILKRLGMNFSSLNKLVYATIIEKKGIPFVIRLHEQKTNTENDPFWDALTAEATRDIWDNPKEDEWDDILPNLPSIRKL